MTDADRILLETEAEAAEFKARRLRERLSGTSAPPTPARRREKKPTLPRPREADLENVTPIIEAQVHRDSRRKGMIDR